MITKAALQPNDQLEFTISIAAPVSDWKALQRQLDKLAEGSESPWFGWPLSGVVSQINEVMERLNKTYYASASENP